MPEKKELQREKAQKRLEWFRFLQSQGLSLAAIGRAQTPPISRQRVFQLLNAEKAK